MREIKFRAWENNIKRMVPACRVTDGYFQLQDGRNCGPFMQYTGLKDKNGVEIYEGDVIKTRWDDVGAVVFTRRAWFVIDKIFEDAGDRLLGNWISDSLEVIGNIHENPELVSK